MLHKHTSSSVLPETETRGHFRSRGEGSGGTHLLLVIVICPLTTQPFRDGAPFLLLIETPPTFGCSRGGGILSCRRPTATSQTREHQLLKTHHSSRIKPPTHRTDRSDRSRSRSSTERSDRSRSRSSTVDRSDRSRSTSFTAVDRSDRS